MGERTILVCDTCGKPASETVTIKVARGSFVKDLCASHVTALIAGARKPRRGRPKAVASAPRAPKTVTQNAAAPKRRARPRKPAG